MITVEEASKIIKNSADFLGEEELLLTESSGRILAESWHADRDFPPFDRVTMDGIAIGFLAFANGQRSFPVQEVAGAGMPQKRLKDGEGCIEVMTGSILPLATDTVIRYEDVELKNGSAIINTEKIKQGQNVHARASDKKAGEHLLSAGVKLSSAEIGIGASIGAYKIMVSKLPSIVVISTGDELVEINQIPAPHQIRKSNVYRILSALKKYGIKADHNHLNDDKASIQKLIKSYLNTYDVILLSGGVSKGKYDYIPEVMEGLGINKHFHGVKQRPGKPFWFGRFQESVTVFAFPGNPTSSFACFHKYFLPWLSTSLREKKLPAINACLKSDVIFKPDLVYFLPVSISYDDSGRIVAEPKKGNGSGDLANLSCADAFMELPRGKELFKAGEVYSIFFYR